MSVKYFSTYPKPHSHLNSSVLFDLQFAARLLLSVLSISSSIAIALSALADVQLARRCGARASIRPRTEAELAELLDWTAFTWTEDW